MSKIYFVESSDTECSCIHYVFTDKTEATSCMDDMENNRDKYGIWDQCAIEVIEHELLNKWEQK